MHACSTLAALACTSLLALTCAAVSKPNEEPLFTGRLNVNPPHISTDKSVKYDYDIVYVRARRAGDKVHKRYYTDIATPVTLEAGAGQKKVSGTYCDLKRFLTLFSCFFLAR